MAAAIDDLVDLTLRWPHRHRRTTAASPGGGSSPGASSSCRSTPGLAFYGLAVYLNAFSNEKGWAARHRSRSVSRSSSSSAGRRSVRRADDRRATTCATSSSAVPSSPAASLALLGQVQTQWQLYVVYAVFAVGLRGCRSRPGDHGRHPLVPSASVGRPVGRVDRSVGRRHRASRRSPNGSSTTTASLPPRRGSDWHTSCVASCPSPGS